MSYTFFPILHGKKLPALTLAGPVRGEREPFRKPVGCGEVVEWNPVACIATCQDSFVRIHGEVLFTYLPYIGRLVGDPFWSRLVGRGVSSSDKDAFPAFDAFPYPPLRVVYRILFRTEILVAGCYNLFGTAIKSNASSKLRLSLSLWGTYAIRWGRRIP
jgi:hypothetical protein